MTHTAHHTPRFNPLPSQKQGETTEHPTPRTLSCVSIRSPHKSKGRPFILRLISPALEFQSAPLTKARGDSLAGACSVSPCVFQSAPLTKARGDTNRMPRPSISLRFQSAPLTKARGDRVREGVRCENAGFNPLPSQKQGETVAV